MKHLYTCPDMVGQREDIDRWFFIPTIYSVRTDTNVVVKQGVVADAVAALLDKSSPVNRFFLYRPIDDREYSEDELFSRMKAMPDVVTDFTVENTSPRQWLWSGKWKADPKGKVSNIGDLRRTVRPEDQYAPYGDYYTDLEPLLGTLEQVWRGIIQDKRPAVPNRRYSRG